MELLERTIPRAVSCCFRLVCRDVSVPRFGSLIVLLRFASVTVSRNTTRDVKLHDLRLLLDTPVYPENKTHARTISV